MARFRPIAGTIALGLLLGTIVLLRGDVGLWSIVLLHGAWCAVEASLQPRLRWAAKGAELHLPLVAGFFSGAVAVTAVLDGRSPGLVVAGVGCAVGGLGVALRAASIRRLGSAFLDGADWGPSQARVRDGVYHLRHPAEVGTLLILAATCLLGQSPLATALLILGVLPTSLARILLEERAAARLRVG